MYKIANFLKKSNYIQFYFSTRSWENFKQHLDTMKSHHFDGNGWIPSPETYKHSYFHERSQY